MTATDAPANASPVPSQCPVLLTGAVLSPRRLLGSISISRPQPQHRSGRYQRRRESRTIGRRGQDNPQRGRMASNGQTRVTSAEVRG